MLPASAGVPEAPRAWLLGGACLGTAALAACALALQHLGAPALPGCTLDSPCSRAIASAWGHLPWLRWPVAFAGASHFLALFAAWLLARGGWPRTLAWSARLGALASLTFLCALLMLGALCPYCLTANIANVAFVLLAGGRARTARARRPELAYLAVALTTTLALALSLGAARRGEREREEQALEESTRAVTAQRDARPFTGRHRLGPEQAVVRLVLFTDYQCPDCARLEGEAQTLLAERSDTSLSIKHFPLSKDCNPLARERNQNPHPNACWAARAAEAAGIVAGSEGFWRMHRWLFERGGAFVDAELRAALPALGLESDPFLETLHGAETLARVQADIEEALALGIQSTPMVFINGGELRGWRAPQGLRRAVEALAASAPPAGDAAEDRPPAALEKLFADWEAEPVVSLTPAGSAGSSGASEVVLWGDYLDAGTRELDRELRRLLGAGPGLGYAFHHYPLDSSCSAEVPNTHPGACLAARAVEAAGECGGSEGRAAMHAWLMEQERGPTDDTLSAAARRLGLDPDVFREALASSRVREAVRSDMASARRAGIRSIPFLFVAGRRVPRWKHDGEPVLARILEAAGR